MRIFTIKDPLLHHWSRYTTEEKERRKSEIQVIASREVDSKLDEVSVELKYYVDQRDPETGVVTSLLFWEVNIP